MSSDTTHADTDGTDAVENRSEIVFAYDAEDTNPNGNPLSANDKPRVDETTGKAVVTDVRLKRYLRDQLDDDGLGIYIQNPSKSDADSVLDREDLFTAATGIDDDELGDMTGSEAADAFLTNAVDVRYFGAAVTFDFDNLPDDFPGQFIGPVQFSHARSLNKIVRKSESKQLSTVVSSGGDAEQGTFAADNRLQYAFIPFHGVVNERNAGKTRLSQTDVERLDSLMWRSLKNQTLTRSKMGHQPRLYLRVEYATDDFHIGTLDDGIELTQEKPDKELRNISDVVLGVDDLIESLSENRDHVEAVHFIADRHLTVEANGETGGADHLSDQLAEAVGADNVVEVDPYDT